MVSVGPLGDAARDATAPAGEATPDVGNDDETPRGVADIGAIVRARLFGGEPLRIGRFTVLGILGRGGMGTVFAAYDTELDRRVAIKLLHAGSSSEDERQRLVREARAMAKLAHPNVAHVYEVGVHDERMYVAMEYVRGTTLRRWLEDEPRGGAETLERFLQAGRGLAAAHESGIVHRDFKPDNVIVGEDGRVRVLDFGIAQLGAEAPTERGAEIQGPDGDDPTRLTRTGAVVGTPAYMSPEQIRGEPVGSASDQFSFGVALWEALVGERPFRGNAMGTIAEAVLAGRIAAPAKGRLAPHVEAALRRALAVAPHDRYPSMDALLAAIADDPRIRRRRRAVLALGALVLVGGAAGQRVAVEAERAACREAGEAIASTWSSRTAEDSAAALRATGVPWAEVAVERALPVVDAYAAAWQVAREDVCVRARIDESMSDDLERAAVDCLEERREAVGGFAAALADADAKVAERAFAAAAGLPTIASCTDADALSRELSRPEAMRAEIRRIERSMAAIDTGLLAGHVDDPIARAETLVREAEAIGWDPLVAEAHLLLGMVARGHADPRRAEEELERAFYLAGRSGNDLAAARAAVVLVETVGFVGERPDDGLRWDALAEMMLGRIEADDTRWADREGNLALLLRAKGQLESAEQHASRAIELDEAVRGAEHVEMVGHWVNLGEVQLDRAKFADAERSYRRSLVLAESNLGTEHPAVAYGLIGLGKCAEARGEPSSAVPLYARALMVRQRALGPDHLDALIPLHTIAGAARMLGLMGEARDLLTAGLRAAERGLGPDHAGVARWVGDLGLVEGYLGNQEQARAHGLRALAIQEKTAGPESATVIPTLINLGEAARSLGRYDEARESYARALAVIERVHGPNHPVAAFALNGLGLVATDMGEYDEAVEHVRGAIAVRKRTLGEKHLLFADSLAFLADALAGRGDVDEARETIDRAIEIMKLGLDARHPRIVMATAARGRYELKAGDAETAVRTLEAALAAAEACNEARELGDGDVADVAWSLAQALAAVGGSDPRARALAERSLEVFRTAGAGARIAAAEAFLRGEHGGLSSNGEK